MHKKKAQELLYHIKKTYNDIAVDFSSHRQYFDRYFEIFSPHLKQKQKIVDLGCGNGRLIKFLESEKAKKNNLSFDYTGIDNSENLLKEAKKSHPSYTFIYGDQLSIPLSDNYADILFNIRTFHHIPSKKLKLKALCEMRRVLKNDGILIITVWNLWRIKRLKHLLKAFLRSILTFGTYSHKDVLIGWGREKTQRYYYAFTIYELNKLLMKAGFDLLTAQKSTRSDYSGGSDNDLVIIAKKKSKQVKILDVPFDNITQKEAIAMVVSRFKNTAKNRSSTSTLSLIHAPPEHQEYNDCFFIATPNPEMLLEARKNQTFKRVLQTTSINIPDGFGIILASKWQKTPIHERIPGIDFMQKICEKSPFGTKIFLLGAAHGVAEKTGSVLTARYKNIHIVGTFAGSPAPEEEKYIRKLIMNSEATALFVAFGAPKQELWLARNLPFLHGLKIAMGVGGAFDFISGKSKRAPKWLRHLGMEWLFRLIQEPKRFKRIYNATIKFPVALLLNMKK